MCGEANSKYEQKLEREVEQRYAAGCLVRTHEPLHPFTVLQCLGHRLACPPHTPYMLRLMQVL